MLHLKMYSENQGRFLYQFGTGWQFDKIYTFCLTSYALKIGLIDMGLRIFDPVQLLDQNSGVILPIRYYSVGLNVHFSINVIAYN